VATRQAGSLAHGEHRQLELALALANSTAPDVARRTMPGMGPEGPSGMVALIAGLKAANTLLLVEHDMEARVPPGRCVSVLVDGRVIATGTARRNSAPMPQVRSAYLGEEETT